MYDDFLNKIIIIYGGFEVHIMYFNLKKES